ncbi:MAG: hypothetical protein U5L06_02260 [Rhodovibrio sp.]|nr:hypothetical protein [Rhodovibrio sp.]
MAQLDGCRVVTAEGLYDGHGGPHPAQRAMADQFATAVRLLLARFRAVAGRDRDDARRATTTA